jgi:hypothetical protein
MRSAVPRGSISWVPAGRSTTGQWWGALNTAQDRDRNKPFTEHLPVEEP